MKITERMIHGERLRDLAGVRVTVMEKTRRTIKASYVSYHYYITRGGRSAQISRHAAVLLGVKR